MIRKFKKKPIVIEAIEYDGENYLEVKEFTGKIFRRGNGELIIPTLEDGKDKIAKHVASVGDFIVKGVQGEFYPIKPEILNVTYEEVFDNFDIAL